MKTNYHVSCNRHIRKQQQFVCVLLLLLLLLLLLSRQKKFSLWHSHGAWMKKITSVLYNTLKLDELKYNAIESLF